MCVSSSINCNSLEEMNPSAERSTHSALGSLKQSRSSWWNPHKMSPKQLIAPKEAKPDTSYVEVMSKGLKKQCERCHKCRTMTVEGITVAAIGITNALTTWRAWNNKQQRNKQANKQTKTQTILSNFKWCKWISHLVLWKRKEKGLFLRVTCELYLRKSK